MIEGIWRLMHKEYHLPINLGNQNERTILELVETILDITKSKSKIVFRQLPEDDPKRRCPDISLAKELLNWEPKVTLRSGLRKTIEYFEQVLR